MNRIGERIQKTLRAISIAMLAGVVGIGLSVAPAYAHGDDDDRYRYRRGDYGHRNMSRTDVRRIAAVNGYSDGFEHGIIDRRNRRSFDYRHHDEYRRAIKGFDRDWRYVTDYQRAYRDTYARGYRDGYYGRQRSRNYDRSRLPYYNGRQNPYYGNNPNYNGYGYGNYPYYNNGRGDLDRDEVAQRAAQNGYYAGFQWGQSDAARRNRPNPQGHGAYQHGLDGFNYEWGWASTYQQTYRSYFTRGYQDGYNRRAYDRRYNRRY